MSCAFFLASILTLTIQKMKVPAILLLFLLTCFNGFSFAQNTATVEEGKKEEYTLEIASKFYNIASVPPNDRDVFKIIEIWKEYLQTQNDSLLLKTKYLTPDYLEAMKGQIFYDYMHKSFFHYQILDYKREKNTYLIDTHLYQLFKNDSTITTLSIFQVRAIPVGDTYKIQFMIEENMPKLENREISNINYYYLPSQHTFSEENARKASIFYHATIKAFNHIPSKKMQYFIFPTAQDMFAFWGHKTYFTPGVVMLKENKGIFITHPSECYKHEIVHYIFGKYDPHYIFSEGMATWWSQESNYYTPLKEYIEDIKKEDYQNPKIMKKMIIRKYYPIPNAYYGIGAVLMREAYKKGGKDLVKKIMSTTKEDNELEVIGKYFELETEEEIINFVIELVKNYTS